MSVDRTLTFLIIAVLGYLIVLACRHRPETSRTWLGRTLALILLAYAATIYLQMAMAGELSVTYALPLELCHCVMFACLVSLLRPNRLASEIAYFCGLAGTLPAMMTPDIGTGFPSWEYVQFYWAHGSVLLVIAFLIAGGGFRPRAGSMWRVLIAVNVYAVVVGAIDAAFGWNYGYLCAKPSHPSLMDYLGPWPWYLLSLEAVAIVAFWLLDLPWRLARRPEAGFAKRM
jgi:hypothetical integral membrane protein (TIGR02206 family)